MPTEAKNVFDEIDQAVKDIGSKVIEEASKSSGSQDVGTSFYAGGALFALIAAGAVAL